MSSDRDIDRPTTIATPRPAAPRPAAPQPAAPQPATPPPDSSQLDNRDRASSEPRPLLGNGEKVANRFFVLRFIGQGGMGQVYEAEDLELGSSVALKVMRADRARRTGAVDQVRHEVQLARQVTHRNVCRIFDLFQHRPTDSSWGRAGEPILLVSMELLPGQTLAERLATGEPFERTEAIDILRQLAAGLDAAHAVDVVHGDLSANNVMLVPDGDRERAVITDFGLGRQTKGSAGPWSGGTPAYRAPELHEEGALPTVASDVYALTVLAHELLRGGLPDDEPNELVDVPRSMAKALERGLDPDPEARFSGGGELVENLAPSSENRLRPYVAFLAAVLFLLAGWLVTRDRSGEAGMPTDRQARSLYAQGVEELRLGRLEEAEAALEAAIQEEPGNPLIELARAELWARLGERGRAIRIVKGLVNASESAPRELKLRIEGRLHELTYNWQAAEGIFAALVTVYPDQPSYAVRLASVLSHRGRPDEAVELLKSIRDEESPSPSLEIALARAARAKADLELQRSAAARGRMAAEALNAPRPMGEAGLLESEALFRLGRGEEAKTRLQQSREVFESLGDRFGLALVTVELSDRRLSPDMLPLSMTDTLAEIESKDDPILKAKILVRVARHFMRIHRPEEEVRELIDRAETLAVSTENRLVLAEVRNLQALLRYVLGDIEGSEGLFAEAVETAEASGNLRLMAGVVGNHARVLMHLGQKEKAWKRQEESIAIARQCGCQDVLLLNLYTAFVVASQLEKYDQATELSDAMLPIAEASGDISQLQLAYRSKGHRLIVEKRFAEALGFVRRQRELLEIIGPDLPLAYAKLEEARLLTELDRFEEAEALFDELRQKNPLAVEDYFSGLVQLRLVELELRRQGDLATIDQLLNEVIDILLRYDDSEARRHLAASGVELERRLGRAPQTRKTLERVVSRNSTGADRRPTLIARLTLGRWYRLTGETERARRDLSSLIADPAVEEHPWIIDVAREELSLLDKEPS